MNIVEARRKANALEKIINSLSTLSDDDILLYRAAIDITLRNRNLSFSVGELGERLVIEYFNSTPGLPNLQLAPLGTKNVDALSRNGERYSIKTLWIAKKTGTIYPDPDNPAKQLFEFIIIVKLDKQLKIENIHQFSWKSFIQVRSWDKRMSAWYISVSQKTLQVALSLKPERFESV